MVKLAQKKFTSKFMALQTTMSQIFHSTIEVFHARYQLYFNVVIGLVNDLAYFIYLDHEWFNTNYLFGTYWCSTLTMYINRHVLYRNLCTTCFDHSTYIDCLDHFDHSDYTIILLENDCIFCHRLVKTNPILKIWC